VDGRADVFSLASVAYTLLTGRAAFLAPTIPGIVHRVVYEDPDPPSRFVPGLPRDVERVLARALAKAPADRYPTAEAFAEDVEDVLAGAAPRHTAADDRPVTEEPESPLAALLADEPSPPPPPPPGPVLVAAGATRSFPPPRRRRRDRRGLVLAGVAAGLGLLALLFWIGRAPAPRPSGEARPRPPSSLQPEPSGRLRIDFEHPLRRGTLRVFVDNELTLEEQLTGQQTKKALVFKVHQGSFRDELEIAPGLHEVRVEVRWDGNAKTARIVGSFRPGATRRLEASLGRIRHDLGLKWK
jgi:hypothetical protein